jgi:hypothetical protein
MIKVVSSACAGFEAAEPQRQRALAAALLENATWTAGKFESRWASPFDKMALSNSVSKSNEREKPGSGQEIENWLPKNPVIQHSRRILTY